MGALTLSGKGRRWLGTGHPWVYADDVASGEGEPGELLPVSDPNGGAMGWGLFSSHSRIAVRMVTRSPEQPKRAFWEERMRYAVELRRRAGLLEPDLACRLVSGDAEGIPGLLVDRYGTTLVLQCTTQGADRMRDFLVELLLEALPFEPEVLLDRSDVGVRKLEGLQPRVETLRGSVDGPVWVREGEVEYGVDIEKGHKTGAYLDQRENRLAAGALAEGRVVLDAFSYDGLFALQAAKAGAERVVCIEQNQAAGERILANARRNGVEDRIEVARANCMQDLRRRAEEGERYGLLIVDPPAFARNRKEAQGAERGYVELNRRAMTMVNEGGGHVVSASCSYNVHAEDFLSYLRSSSRLVERPAWLEEMRGAGIDHPHLLTLPETRYLKCAFVRVG